MTDAEIFELCKSPLMSYERKDETDYFMPLRKLVRSNLVSYVTFSGMPFIKMKMPETKEKAIEAVKLRYDLTRLLRFKRHLEKISLPIDHDGKYLVHQATLMLDSARI